MAFSPDSRYVFVSNRDEGTVTVIETATRKKVKDIRTGALPISLAYSSQAGAIYVADGKDGSVSVIDAKTLEPRAKIRLKTGLGPLRFDPSGRWALVVNPGEDKVFVIDAASNELTNTIDIKGEPYQIVFSQTFAYVRALRSERVSLITLASLGKGSKPAVQSFAAGAQAPKAGGQLAIADAMASGGKDGTFFVVNPADNTTYYYMEGMNSPSSNYSVKGGSARAVALIDRSLKEIEPGVYAGKVKLPAPGHYDVAFLMQTPQVLHCFSADAKANPQAPRPGLPLAVEFDEKQRTVAAGGPLKLRFRLKDTATGQPKTGLTDARVMFFLAPGRMRTEVAAKEIGGGEYEAELPIRDAGAYYVYVGVPSMRLGYDRLPFFTLRAVQGATPAPSAAGNG
jgi:YVTN family beta-propeller protein